MAVFVAYRGDRPQPIAGRQIDVLGPQLADSVSSASPIVVDKPGLYVIWTTAAHTIFIRPSQDAGTASTNGESWASGEKQIVALDEGDKICYT